MKPLKPEKNSKYAQISFYAVLSVVIIFIIIRIFDHLPVVLLALGRGLHWLGVILRPLISGFFLAYLVYPLTAFFQRTLRKIPRWKDKEKLTLGLAVLITLLVAFLIVFLLLTLMISTVTKELHAASLDDLSSFLTGLASTVRGFFRSLTGWLNSLNLSSADLSTVVDKLAGYGSSLAESIGSSLLSNVSKLPTFLAGSLFALIFSIYFLLDGKGLRRYWKNVYRAFTNQKIYNGTKVFLKDANLVFSGYIRGQLMDAVFMAVVVSVSLTLIRVPFSVLIGILSGIGNLIPYLGPVIAYGSTALVCLLEGDLKMLLISVIVVFVIQTIDGNVINPRFLANTTNVHPVLVIVALLIGSKAGGIAGMIFAVPVAALLKIEFERLIQYLNKKRAPQNEPAAADESHKEQP
jgi:predicted PurR-regulated permease PerM